MSNTTKPFTVRSAEPGDGAVLGQLGALLVAAHHDFDPKRFISPGAGTARGYGAFLISQIARPNRFVFVAEEAGIVLGYTFAALEEADYMALRGPAGVVHDLVVDPQRRKEGVGRLLLSHVIAELTKRGAPRVVLMTAERNIAARSLFASAGFRPTMVEMTWEPD